ncbi:MAG TPA: DUF4328 domain-containing protein [Bacteroidia bacterium]|jgi:hypothetical protein|nr:DUF4328 domain-containing protein [Bacteroidia bacterium]
MDTILDFKEGGHWIKDNKTRAKSAVIMLWISIVCCILSFLISWYEYELLSGDIQSHLEEIKQMAYLLSAIGFLVIVARILTATYFIRWFRRAYNNLYLIGVPHLESPEGMAAGAWFIPFYNLFKPFGIMKEISHNTEHYVHQANPAFDKPSAEKKLGWWWGFWIAYAVCSGISSGLATRRASISSLRDNALFMLIIELLQITAALFCIQIIRRISAYEQEMMLHEKVIQEQLNLATTAVK